MISAFFSRTHLIINPTLYLSSKLGKLAFSGFCFTQTGLPQIKASVAAESKGREIPFLRGIRAVYHGPRRLLHGPAAGGAFPEVFQLPACLPDLPVEQVKVSTVAEVKALVDHSSFPAAEYARIARNARLLMHTIILV